ncbi:hypothetical protein METP2_02092 [Methanosarcinales archaeon]|uniref:Protein clustered with O-phosphoseryl-tRNA(Cys) synthetase n=2 Tax=Candidatus Methanoperedens nitratireducens TaxID=1392998 RepID=A0A284VP55_9EURY|nr:DUF169 domain-containing protein [Candidatus Methanoperedens nitroreducens]KAB2943445.1 MAG: protein clustered with O-phosphoseryl-tRNA(Cys) synthetase [Candidatus Methanoperedens sp.]MBZ0177522.1 DUF169 domain-containing protein [Candidatus Methanoperedens nitroreducens]CAG0983002.1 hypothetical protein METP2_02092 [Methanosarcinales archaeon]SNQ61076.1 conserved hypothetical protein [Candidatus Methanoperedens nitroreducens]
MLENITRLMEKGNPVSILISNEKGTESPLLYCELVHRARYGESFIITSQGCSVCEYVFCNAENSPGDYYNSTGRYKNQKATSNAVSSLKRFEINGRSIRITPFKGEKFDVLILYLKPVRAMRIIQAYAYLEGKQVKISTGGIASICSDCTVNPLRGKLSYSLGCKGSRKHSKYGDDEVVVGIPFELAKDIDEALGKIPETLS